MKINKRHEGRMKLNNNCNDHDRAILMACEKFEERYPNGEQPTWLKYCMWMNVMKNQNKNWVVKFYLSPKPVLKSNQYWEWEDDGIPLLIEVDSITNKKSIVICGGAPVDPEVFFEAEINLEQNFVIVHKELQLDKLDGNKYEMNRR